MQIKKHIPNAITLLNLFCGCIAVVFVAGYNHETAPDNFEYAFYFVCLGIFLDFFDGFFARLFNVSSPLGLQLDSLADMVTSGLVPGFVMYQLMANGSNPTTYFSFLGFIITLGSCYRLANFNIDERQTDSFIGLPTPANALFIMSLPMVKFDTESLFILEAVTDKGILLGITLCSAYLLNADIPLFSLKIKKITFKDNIIQIVFLALSLLLLLTQHYLGIPLLIIMYVLMSVINNKLIKK